MSNNRIQVFLLHIPGNGPRNTWSSDFSSLDQHRRGRSWAVGHAEPWGTVVAASKTRIHSRPWIIIETNGIALSFLPVFLLRQLAASIIALDGGTEQAYGSPKLVRHAGASLIQPTACRTEEWRNAEWTSRQLRQFHEHNAARSVSNQSRWRSVLEIEGVLHSRQHGTLLHLNASAISHRSTDQVSTRSRSTSRFCERGTKPGQGSAEEQSRWPCWSRSCSWRCVTSAREMFSSHPGCLGRGNARGGPIRGGRGRGRGG